ncbi:MAG: MarR family transcriptional regulator [Cyclobacteriaceae bacterium]|nr:MarR family transcriptional regulator [Cyclobacteriaceae bacterium]
MSIGEDIQQARFESEFHKAAVNILFTGGWLHHINAGHLKKHHITPEQYNVLRILKGSHPDAMRLLDITSRMIDKNSNCTRLVEKLRAKGLVSRELCENNRRQVDIGITAKGLNLLKKIEQEGPAWKTAMKTLNKKEAEELNRLLDKLRG